MTQCKPHNLKDKQHIDSLTGARFFAVMIVVFSHFEFLKQYGKFGDIFWNYYHNNATMAVDFFFMLSGFGMMLSSIRRDPNGELPIGGISGLINYGIRHIRKIYPVYVAFLLVGIPAYLYVGYFDYGQSLWKLIANSTLFFFFDLTLLQSVTGHISFSHSLNGVCWFLSTLFCIYLISPIIIKFIKRRIKPVKQSFICLMLSIFISFLLSILFSWVEGHTSFDDLWFGSPYRRVFYVTPGMFIAQIYKAYDDNRKCLPTFITTGIFEYVFFGVSLLWYLLRYPCQDALGHFVYAIDMIVVAGDLFALSVSYGKISQIFSNKRLVFLGECSMYIYLSHYLIRTYVNRTIRIMGLEFTALGFIKVVVNLTLTMGISIAIWHFRTVSRHNLKRG